MAGGRVELTIEDEIVTRSVIDPALLEKVSFTKNALRESLVYVTCKKGGDKCPTIIETFNAGLSAIKADGTLDKLLNNP